MTDSFNLRVVFKLTTRLRPTFITYTISEACKEFTFPK